MHELLAILIVDDDIGQREMATEFLRISGFMNVIQAGSLASMWEVLSTRSFDVMLLDYRLPDGTGIDALPQIRAQGYSLPIVIVTGAGDERVAVSAMQRGAADYIMKTGDYLVTLPAVIRKVIQAYELQQSVRHSQEIMRYQATLLNNVRDAIVVWDLQGKITYWNPAAESLYGWRKQDRIDSLAAETYFPIFSPPIRLPQAQDPDNKPVTRKFTDPRGQRMWVSSRVTVLQDTSGQNHPLGYMDVAHDITQRVLAEENLRKERNFVSAVLDTVGALVVVLDRQGKIFRLNRACENSIGYTSKQVRNTALWDLLLPEDERQEFQVFFNLLLTAGGPKENETHLVTRTGEQRLISWSNTVITNSRGTVDYVIATGIDITERRQAERALQKAQARLVEATRLAAIGEMASGVAHQINNPLTTIIADAQILLKLLPPGIAGHESADAIQQAGWRVQEAVQRLFDFSRPAPTTLETFSVNSSIERALPFVRTQIESAGIHLALELGNDLPSIRGTLHQLEHLWVYLLWLARDACIDGQPHTIRLLTAAGSDGCVHVEMQDDGIPIPMDQQATFFEPNFIGPVAGRGTGLEPSICREIVRQHGGEIRLIGFPSALTVFHVTFPAETGDLHPVSAPQDVSHHLDKRP